nr:MAG TPA: hypothetical protein [Caudoviricetes sp.]
MICAVLVSRCTRPVVDAYAHTNDMEVCLCLRRKLNGD